MRGYGVIESVPIPRPYIAAIIVVHNPEDTVNVVGQHHSFVQFRK